VRARLHEAARAAFVRLAAGYIELCWRTTRWTVEGADNRAATAAHGGPFLAVFWHGRLVFSPLWALPGRRTVAMISAARDGDVFARIAERFGILCIRGSSADPRKPGKDKGGRAVTVAALRALRDGSVVAIAVDGPRGPRMRSQPGVSALAAAAGVPVQPIAFATRRGVVLNSWDRFVLPLPFDRGVMVYGPALPPPEPDAQEAHRAAVDAALIDATARADAAVGRTPVAPA
jgi:lysophospholipid acyltransferase (LPLAT)-like uncharacterized protein